MNITKKTFIPLLLLLFFVKGYSQQSNKINFEGGLVINTPLIKSERLKSPDNPYDSSPVDWTYKYYSSTGYYFKFCYDSKLISKKKWSLFLPVGLSLISQKSKYDRLGHNGDVILITDNSLRTINDKNANLMFGPLLQFENKKVRYSGSIFLNTCLTFYSSTHYSPYNPHYEKNRSEFQHELYFYFSSQLSILYNIKSNIWLGISNEIFYRNAVDLIFKNNYPNYDPSIKITGKNIWINPAIKLQLDLN